MTTFLSNREIYERVIREFGALLEIPDNHPKFVLSMDPVDMSADGITHLNVRDFLMQESNCRDDLDR